MILSTFFLVTLYLINNKWFSYSICDRHSHCHPLHLPEPEPCPWQWVRQVDSTAHKANSVGVNLSSEHSHPWKKKEICESIIFRNFKYYVVVFKFILGHARKNHPFDQWHDKFLGKILFLMYIWKVTVL